MAIINGNLNEFREKSAFKEHADDELIINGGGGTNDEWEKCVESVCDCRVLCNSVCLRNVGSISQSLLSRGKVR